MHDAEREAVARMLVSVAMSDGQIGSPERERLARLCRGLGVAPAALDGIIAEISRDGPLTRIPVPEDDAGKAQILRSMVEIMQADGQIGKDELDYCLKVAQRYGVSADAVRRMVRDQILGAVPAAVPQPAARAPESKPNRPPPGSQGGPWLDAARSLIGRIRGLDVRLAAAMVIVALAGSAYAVSAAVGFCREHIGYRRAVNSGSAADFDAYLAAHPSGRHVREVSERRDDLRFSTARDAKEARALESYVDANPSGRHVAEARALGADLRYAEVSGSGLEPQLEEFLARYSSDPRAPELRSRLEDILWEGVRASQDEAAVTAFHKRFPNGRYAQRAGDLLQFLVYRRVFASRDITQVNRFLAGESINRTYRDSLLRVRGEIWDDAITDYAENARRLGAAGPRVRFFRAMLTHMRDAGDGEVGIAISGRFDLTDFADIPADARGAWDRLQEAYNEDLRKEGKPPHPLPSAKPPASLKGSFTPGDIDGLKAVLAANIEGAIRKEFGDKLFRIVRNPSAENRRGAARLEVDYVIANVWHVLRNGLRMPDLISVYDSTTSGGVEISSKFSHYRLNTQIDWKVSLSIPQTSQAHSFTAATSSKPLKYKEGEQPYALATRNAFAEFGTEIANRFGLSAADPE